MLQGELIAYHTAARRLIAHGRGAGGLARTRESAAAGRMYVVQAVDDREAAPRLAAEVAHEQAPLAVRSGRQGRVCTLEEQHDNGWKVLNGQAGIRIALGHAMAFLSRSRRSTSD